MEVLRNEVAVVLQKNVLFSGTILENLRWGNENATEEECRQACEAACASEFIERLPDGYNTWLERGGTNVSGGQKQRLCIAQRVSSVQDADRILVLDNGKNNGFDTHENLLKNNEIYRDIYESQVKGGGDFDQAG